MTILLVIAGSILLCFLAIIIFVTLLLLNAKEQVKTEHRTGKSIDFPVPEEYSELTIDDLIN